MNPQMKIFNSTICRILFATCLSALCLIALSTRAATISVTNNNDSGAGSLRQALADALVGDTINFDPALDGQTITLTGRELLVNKSITINGPGPNTLTVDGNHASRVFHVSGGVTAAIAGLTIANGSTSGAPPYNNGGGVYNDHSTLTVSNCTFSGNSAAAPSGAGGGIFNDAFFGTATLEVLNCTLSGNSADGNGGGLFNEGGSGNATLRVVNSTLSGNSATLAGGIYNGSSSGSATLEVTNSTLSGNSAFEGGAIFNAGVGSSSAAVRISNSTLSGNSGAAGAGGIYNYSVNSGSAMITIGDSILKNTGGNIFNAAGSVTSLGYNLSSDWGVTNAGGTGDLTGPGDQVNTDPMLGPLQDNGGPTFTHELLAGSPAFDAGDPNFTPPPDYDQRGPGFPRVVNGRIDIGAFESHLTPTPTPTATATATATATSTPTATATATATPTATATATSTPTPTPTPTATPAYAAQVQPPINSDGSSTFNVRRGVVPVKFNLTLGGVATCDLPPATIAVTRTAGGVIGQVNESDYSGNADTGSNFRISSCQYVYNLNAQALGVGTYRVDILINGQVVGSAVFGLN
jgi:hypothetical protein